MTVAQLISTDTRRALIGIGVTGSSVARYLKSRGKAFDVYDTREAPGHLKVFKDEFPDLDIYLGEENLGRLGGYSEIILSPGIDSREPWVQSVAASGTRVIGDIELFAQAVNAPVIAITGSNAKSTVTTLVGEMAKEAGIKVAVGGNLGTAALDLLSSGIELYVLELSSFQLELVQNLQPLVACILNMSADHMDRYDSMISYHAAKQRIYRKAENLVFNREDPLTQPLLQQDQCAVNFAANEPDIGDYGLRLIEGERWLVKGHNRLLPETEVALKGTHNLCNVLAAMALASIAGIDDQAQIHVAKRFSGLEHRSQLVRQRLGVNWINDSKATNVGAVKAALSGLGTSHNIVLIAGGQAKGQSFEGLKKLADKYLKLLILMGEDADQIASELKDSADIVYAVNMEAAVQTAASSASPGDTVLLSPACASFDMFSGYQERGYKFAEAVERLS